MNSQKNYVFGFDLGISSVGWSIVEYRSISNDDRYSFGPYRIINIGIRHFSAAEVPKTGASPNLTRRESRSTRKRLRRRKHRLKRLRTLFMYLGWISSQSDLAKPKPDVWNARSKAIHEEVSDLTLAKAIYHLVKNRGFKSNRKTPSTQEEGEFKKIISETKTKLHQKGYKTLGEMLAKDDEYAEKKRNSENEYLVMASRSLLLDELKEILETQSQYKPEISEKVSKKILDLFEKQRPFSSGDDILNKVGECRLEEGENRAARYCPSMEYKNVIVSLANIRLLDTKKYTKRALTDTEKQKALDKAMTVQVFRYSQLRTAIDLAEHIHFAGLQYSKNKNSKKKKPESKVIAKVYGTRQLAKALDFSQDEVAQQREYLDKIATILTLYKTDGDLREQFHKLEVSDEQINKLLKITNFSGFGKFSLKAIYKLLPYLENGLDLSEAIEQAGYENTQVLQGEHEKLPPIDTEDINNPSVVRTLTQARKVLNALIRKYGPPVRIHIESTRSLGLSKSIRNKISKKLNDRRKANEKVIKILQQEFNISDPSGTDIFKYKLWEEQCEKCIYSLQRIDPHLLFEGNHTQIDHAIPYSRSLDDSYFNKVLSLTSENMNKRNQTPFEYFGENSENKQWQRFAAYVISLPISSKKKNNLLRTEAPDSDTALQKFINKNLSDTRYVTNYFANHIRQNLKFAEFDVKKRVYSISGSATALLRKRWGLPKDRDKSIRHHAQDAILTAVISPSLLYQIQNWHRSKETFQDFKDDSTQFPEPWDGFRKDVINRVFEDELDELSDIFEDPQLSKRYADIQDKIKPLFVSKMPERRLSGPLHKDTILSTKHLDDKGVLTKRISIFELGKRHFTKDLIIGNDPALKAALKQRLEKFDWKAKNAFTEPIFKPSKSGNGNQIKKVTIAETASSYLPVRKDRAGNVIGVAKNAQQVRVDVFQGPKNKYYLVPIYTYDVAQGELPNKAIKPLAKSEDEWIEMTDEYQFLFSLYKNDYVSTRKKKKRLNFYFSGANRNTGSIGGYIHDRNQKVKIGAKLLDSLEKYYVTVLGQKYKVTSEVRNGF